MRCRRHCVASLLLPAALTAFLCRDVRCFRRTALDHTGRGRRPFLLPLRCAPPKNILAAATHSPPFGTPLRNSSGSVARTAAAPRGGRRSAAAAAARALPPPPAPPCHPRPAAGARRGGAARRRRRHLAAPRPSPRSAAPAPPRRSAPRRPWPLWRLSARTASAAARRPAPHPHPSARGGHRPSTTATERHPNSTWRRAQRNVAQKVGRWTIPSRFPTEQVPPPYGDVDVRNASMKTPPLSTLFSLLRCRARGAHGAERLTDSSAAGGGARPAAGTESRRDECAQPCARRSCGRACRCVCAPRSHRGRAGVCTRVSRVLSNAGARRGRRGVAANRHTQRMRVTHGHGHQRI